MITANQAAKLHVAQALYEARHKLAEIQSSIFFGPNESRQVGELCQQIDKLFATAIPNSSIQEKA